MKTQVLFLLLLLLAAALPAQEPKGVTPLASPAPSGGGRGEVRAVIVGISDYQSPAIPDLQYADYDARAFADWLQSPGGGNVPAENIVLLTNEKATNARFSASLYWLVETCGEGDHAIIYFSGHGDVETKTRGQLGFLLAWDTPPTNYNAGAYSIFYLQDIISTLSIDKKARVTVITDVCHAGKLAGSSIGGTQATAQALAQQFANEVKIMSCQPNEFSLEGPQWGTGRGVFSYHLLDGLSGLADQNADGEVTLREVNRYLEDNVTAEASPHPQTPLTVGERNTLLARVNPSLLAEIRQRKKGEPQLFGGTDTRGLTIDADSVTRVTYHRFEAALAAGNLLGPDSSADFYFKQLVENQSIRSLHGLIRRNFAVALQDEVQQALNALLADDPYETNNWLYNPKKFADFPRYLHRTIELLGKNHYMYPTLRAKELYFEGYNLAQALNLENATAAFQDSVRALAKEKMLEAIVQDPQAAYPYYSIGKLYWWNSPPHTDSLVLWCERAIERAPHWLLPYLDVAYEYNSSQNDPITSEQWLNKAITINPHSYIVQERLSWLYQWLNRMDESLALSEKMIQERPELFNAYSTAGVNCITRKEYRRAENYFKRSLTIEPGLNNWANLFLISLYISTRRQQQAIALVDSIFNSPGVSPDIRSTSLDYLRSGLLQNRQYDQAAYFAEKQAKLNIVASQQAGAEATLGVAQIMKGHYPEGRAWLQKACKTDSLFVTAWPLMLHQYEAIIAEQEGHFALADSFFREAFRFGLSNMVIVDSVSFFTEPLFEDYGRFLLRQKRWAEATAQFQKLLEEEPNAWRGYLGMALFHAQKGHATEALDWLEKALDHWLPTPELANEEPLFSTIKNTKRFKALMAKNFPPGWESR